MVDTWQGYFAVTRITANINDDNWVLLVEELKRIVANGNRCEQLGNIHKPRGDVNMFNHGTEEVPDWYSDAYLFSANFNTGAIDFDKFQNRLVNLFEVPEENVTYNTSMRTIRDRLSVTATYMLAAKARITVELLGCASDSELCTTAESNAEVLGMLHDDAAQWGEEVS